MGEISLLNTDEIEIMKNEKNINSNKKTRLVEIIKNIFVGNYEDSKNILLLNNTKITNIIIVRCNKEDNLARINYPTKFEYYIIEIMNNEDAFEKYTYFKYLLDEIFFEKDDNKIFIHSYKCLKNILFLLLFYIVTTLNINLDNAINYIKKIIDFEISIEEEDKIFYFTKKHYLTYYPGEFTTYLDVMNN